MTIAALLRVFGSIGYSEPTYDFVRQEEGVDRGGLRRIEEGRMASASSQPAVITIQFEGEPIRALANRVCLRVSPGTPPKKVADLAFSVGGRIIRTVSTINLYELEAPASTPKALQSLIESLQARVLDDKKPPRWKVERAYPNILVTIP